MSDYLTPEEEAHVMRAGLTPLIDLMLGDDKAVLMLAAADAAAFARIYNAGVSAGVEAYDRVLTMRGEGPS